MAYDQQNAYRSQAGGRVSAADIDEGLRAYMLRVYNYMALGVAWTAVVTMFIISNQTLLNTLAYGPGKWVALVALIGMGFFAHKLILTGNTFMAQASFWVYASLWGILVSPMIHRYLGAGKGDLILQAFAITAVTFAATSLFGYVTKKNLSAFGTFFVMASIGLFIAMLANAFIFQSTMGSLIISCLVVLVFAGITAWETQEIKESYFGGDDQRTVTGKAIFGAFILYGSFMTLFIHILNILGIMDD